MGQQFQVPLDMTGALHNPYLRVVEHHCHINAKILANKDVLFLLLMKSITSSDCRGFFVTHCISHPGRLNLRVSFTRGILLTISVFRVFIYATHATYHSKQTKRTPDIFPTLILLEGPKDLVKGIFGCQCQTSPFMRPNLNSNSTWLLSLWALK